LLRPKSIVSLVRCSLNNVALLLLLHNVVNLDQSMLLLLLALFSTILNRDH
jgi:hypothetical protein